MSVTHQLERLKAKSADYSDRQEANCEPPVFRRLESVAGLIDSHKPWCLTADYLPTPEASLEVSQTERSVPSSLGPR